MKEIDELYSIQQEIKKRRARYEKLKAKFEQASEEESNDT